MEAIWQDAKDIIKNELPSATFDLWIEPLQAESGSGGELILSCPNPFALRWIQANYLKQIRHVLETALEQSLPVHLKLLTAPARQPVPIKVCQPALPLAPEKPRSRGLKPGLYF